MENQRKIITAIFFFALFAFVWTHMLRIFGPFLEAAFWAAVLAYAFFPLHRFFAKMWKKQATLAALVTSFCVVLIVITPATLIVKNLLEQTVQLYPYVSSLLRLKGLDEILVKIQALPTYQTVQRLASSSTVIKENLSDVLLNQVRFLANGVTGQLAAVTKNIFLLSFDVVLTVIFLYMLLKNGERIYRFFYDLIPLEESDRKFLFGKLNTAFSGVIRGQLVTGIVQGILAGLTFFFLGIPASSFLGFATFFASMIPMTGASTVWVPVTAYLFLVQDLLRASILLVVGVFVISLSDNILKPILIRERTKIPAFVLFFAILGGLRLYGFTGIFLGPVMVALFFALIEIYRERYGKA
jgi:predicted PurR-regulated permease PerM